MDLNYFSVKLGKKKLGNEETGRIILSRWKDAKWSGSQSHGEGIRAWALKSQFPTLSLEGSPGGLSGEMAQAVE